MLVNLNDVLKPAREYHYGVGLFNIIYNKNSPTSSGSEMNCRFDMNAHK